MLWKVENGLNSRRAIYFPVIFVIILSSYLLLSQDIDQEKKEVYENDGRIMQEADSYYFRKRIAENDEHGIYLEFNRFYGVQTLRVIDAGDNSEIALDYRLLVKGGKFKVVLLTPEGELLKVAEQDGEGTFSVPASEGDYRVKIVGENADGIIEIHGLLSDN